MNHDSVIQHDEETNLGMPMVPEPENAEYEVHRTLAEDTAAYVLGAEPDELYLSLSPEEEAEDLTSEPCESVPHGTKSESGTKVIKKADLVSMWKYMLSRSYANKRRSLYTFMNSLLRRGMLSEIVGFKVLNKVINRQACEFTGVTFWKIDRENFYADVKVTLACS